MSYGTSFIDGGIRQVTEYVTKSTPNITFNVGGGGVAERPAMSDIVFVSADGVSAPQTQKSFDSFTLGVPLAEQASLMAGSLQFTLNGERYVEQNGQLYKNIDPATGSGVEVGYVDLVTGGIAIDSWTSGISPQATINAGLMQYGDSLITTTTFRAPVSPVRPGSFQITATRKATGAVVTATANTDGILNSSFICGKIDYQSGVAQIFFGRKTGDPLNEVALDISSMVPGVTTWYADPVFAATARFSLVGYTYLPLDSEILGIDPVRLPSDGRVAVFKPGDVVVVHHTAQSVPTTVSNGQTINLGRERLARIRVIGNNGDTITAGYTADLDAGTVTFDNVSGYSQPVTVENRIEDMALCSEAQINGQLAFTRQLTHDFPANESYASSALIIGDMRARVPVVFDQATWNSVWQDIVSGSNASASYNTVLHPFEVTNAGAITEQWVLHFTNTTTFNVIGKNVGQIITGTVAADLAPINPATGVPYFTIRSDGWGSGWSAGNAVRFNTVGALAPVWIARTIQQGAATAVNDDFTILVRGDVDNP